MKPNYTKEDTIVMSDFHLGSTRSKAKEIAGFLTELTKFPPKRLVLAGDVFELWSTNYKNIGNAEHRVITLVAHLSELGTKIVYIPGNHDRAFGAFYNFTFGKIKMRTEYVIRHGHKKYLVLHGDEFDAFTRNHVVISILLDQLYGLLIKMWSFMNFFSRSKTSLSAEKNSKKYEEIVGKMKKLALSYARSRKLDGIIIGHSHWPEIDLHTKGFKDLLYVNSGDWIESCSYVVVGDEVKLEYYK